MSFYLMLPTVLDYRRQDHRVFASFTKNDNKNYKANYTHTHTEWFFSLALSAHRNILSASDPGLTCKKLKRSNHTFVCALKF